MVCYMANITIKEMPDALHKELRQQAELEGRSLNSYVIHLLELGAEERARRRRMREGREAFRKFVASIPPMGDSTELIREDRDQR